MQGKSNNIGSSPESVEFERASSSPRNTQRIFWGDIKRPEEKRLMQCEGAGQIMGGWCVGESSSSQNGPKPEHFLPPSSQFNGFPFRNVHLVSGRDHAGASQSLNLNGGSCQASQNSSSWKDSSSDGFRRPCKRKLLEESVGSSSSMSQLEGNLWNNMNSLGISVSSQSTAPIADSSIRVERAEGSRRSSRSRMNPLVVEAPPNPGMVSIDFSAAQIRNQTGMEAFSTSHQNTQLRWQENAGANVTPSNDPEARNLLDNPFPVVVNGSSSVPRSIIGGRNVGNPLPHRLPTAWAPQFITSRSSSRLSDYLRRSLFPSSRSEHGNPVYMRAEGQPHGQFPRSGANIVGIPYPIRALTNHNEGSNIPEHMRNVLQMMRRGEGMRYEDLLLLDQSAFLAMIDRHRDMRMDVDNMSYEELLALEDRIGYVSTGLSEQNVLKLLKRGKHSNGCQGEPCCICQEEYCEGDDVGRLDCGHVFHSECVKQWLKIKNLCPICKTTGLVT